MSQSRLRVSGAIVASRRGLGVMAAVVLLGTILSGPAPAAGSVLGCSPTGVWEWIHSPNPQEEGGSTFLTDIAGTSSTDVWTIGGYTGMPEGARVTWHFDGTGWEERQILTGYVSPYLQAITSIGQDELWAVGRAVIEYVRTHAIAFRWDGVGWMDLSPDLEVRGPELVDVSGSSSQDVWAVGNYETDDLPVAMAIHWGGAGWTQTPMPTPEGLGSYANGVAAVGPDEAWAVGQTLKDPDQPLIWRWDGVAWSIVPTPMSGEPGILVSVAASSDEAWAVGLDYQRAAKSLVMHWNGVAWAQVNTPERKRYSTPADVAMAPSGRAWIVGRQGPGLLGLLVMQWDGSRWSVQRAPDPGTIESELVAVTALDDSAWAAGTYARIEPYQPARSLVERRCVG
jgi:hypothetical protein